MNEKRILAGLLVSCLSCFLFHVSQLQKDKTVLAETLMSTSSQLEKKESMDSQVIDDTIKSESKVTSESLKETRKTIETQSTIVSPVTSSESSEVISSDSPSFASVAATQPSVTTERVEKNYQLSIVKNQSTEEFIQLINTDAQEIAWREGLYASVMIAQAILETGSGNSQLARPPHHNLFGIKGSYQGKNVTFNTQEDKGNGQLYTIKSAFRQYPSYKESLEDYASLLKRGISGNPSFYQVTWKENAPTYKEATKALTGKYATDTSYDKKLNALIETYSLTMYDLEPSVEEKNDSPEASESISESTEASIEQTENETTDSSTTDETKILMSETKRPVITLPPISQRPAKEMAGNRIVQ